ncbi:MAG: 6-hydroxymethylpterin diphosphokinase MptE-like protein [Methanobacteriota archaeon]
MKIMRWELWEPWYEKIADRLKLDRNADEEAAKLLDGLLPKPKIKAIEKIVRGHDCIVFGAGPSLDEDLRKLKRAGHLDKVLISADGATSAVMQYRDPEIIVTDLDGAVEDQLDAWRRGSWLVVHGHGDNLGQVRKFVPKLKERIIGTTQVKPFGKLFNFGGFTDGDRAAFTAHELGSSNIFLVGMDLGSKIGKHSGIKVSKRKLMKLDICGELLSWLAGDLGAHIVNMTTAGEPIDSIQNKPILSEFLCLK